MTTNEDEASQVTIAHLPRFLSRKDFLAKKKELTAVQLIKVLSKTLLFDEDGEIIHFEVARHSVTVWRGYDPDGKEKSKKAMASLRRKLRRKGFQPYPGAPPSKVLHAFGIRDQGKGDRP